MFKLLPITITVAILFLGVKISDVLQGTQTLLISSVEAQQPEKPSNVSTEKPKDVMEKKDAAPEHGDKKEGEKEGEKKEASKNPNVSDTAGDTTDRRFTSVEVELLQSLAKRREELDRWERNIEIKEAALDATQKRIDEKIEQIENMKKEVAVLLAQYNNHEDAKIRSLVKIYENMKPTEAARIFDELEMPVLLLVVDAMAEKKAAPILANMSPKRAKQVTVELANERKVNSNKPAAAALNDAAAPASKP